MTESEFSFMYSFLCEAYNKEINENQMLVWYDFFKEYDQLTFKNAIVQCINESKFFPTIADIKQKLVKQTSLEAGLKADEEYDKVIEAIRQYGYMREEEALNSLNPLTRNIVRRIGYQELCCADINREYILRSAFIKSFESEQEDFIRYELSNNTDTEEMKLICERNKEFLNRIASGLVKRIDYDGEEDNEWN
jgi:hypothetical protein